MPENPRVRAGDRKPPLQVSIVEGQVAGANESRGEMAYTLVDVDSPVDDAVVAALAAIDGVLSVRAIPAESN